LKEGLKIIFQIIENEQDEKSEEANKYIFSENKGFEYLHFLFKNNLKNDEIVIMILKIINSITNTRLSTTPSETKIKVNKN
jgi:hypothetical protein